MRRLALISILVLAACSSSDEPTATTAAETPSPPATAVPESTAAPPTTTAPPPTTTTTTTTTTLSPNAAPAFGLTQVVFGEASSIVVTNWGDGPGNLEGYWLSQGPLFKALPQIELDPGEQTLLGLAPEPPPELAGMAVVAHLGPTIGVLQPEAGEVALFAGSPFDSPESIVAYVAWGSAPHSWSDTAITAGVWSEGTVEVVDEAPSISSGVFPVSGSSDWFADVGG